MKKHKLIVIAMLILMMSCMFTGCAGKRIIEKSYDEDSDISTIQLQFINEIDIGEWCFEDDYYGIAGLYDSDGERCEFTFQGMWTPCNKNPDERGATNRIEIEFKGHYKGYIYRTWYMNSDDAYELDYNIYELEKKTEFLKKHAYIIEWKL